MTDLLRAEGISKHYQESGLSSVHVLTNFSMTVKAGEVVTLVGPSGSGKSTLLHLLGLLDVPSSGKIFYGQTDVSGANLEKLAQLRAQYLGFVYQSHHLLPEFTALENVIIPQIIRQKNDKHHCEKRAKDLLSQVGLSNRINHLPSQLSGGEQQRVAIARALANAPQIILADEPTGNLDPHIAQEIWRILTDLVQQAKEEGRPMSLLMATHNLSLCELSDRTISL